MGGYLLTFSVAFWLFTAAAFVSGAIAAWYARRIDGQLALIQRDPQSGEARAILGRLCVSLNLGNPTKLKQEAIRQYSLKSAKMNSLAAMFSGLAKNSSKAAGLLTVVTLVVSVAIPLRNPFSGRETAERQHDRDVKRQPGDSGRPPIQTQDSELNESSYSGPGDGSQYMPVSAESRRTSGSGSSLAGHVAGGRLVNPGGSASSGSRQQDKNAHVSGESSDPRAATSQQQDWVPDGNGRREQGIAFPQLELVVEVYGDYLIATNTGLPVHATIDARLDNGKWVSLAADRGIAGNKSFLTIPLPKQKGIIRTLRILVPERSSKGKIIPWDELRNKKR